jgi:multiple sugar transport system permease protein
MRKQGRLAYAIPAGVFLCVLSFYPLLQLARMSMSAVTSATLQESWSFVWFHNFVANTQNPVFWQALGNTAIFVVVVTVISLLGGFAAAVALRSSGRLTAFLLGLMVFIWALPPVVNGSVWKFVPFHYDPHMAIFSVAIVNSWVVIPFNALVFRAALIGIPGEVLEAGKMDGVSAWQEVRFVFIPAVRPTTLVLFVLTVVYAFRSFDFIYVMTYGGPGTATNTLPFLGYLQAFVQFNYGSGAATAIIAAAMVIVLAVMYARSVRKEENAS